MELTRRSSVDHQTEAIIVTVSGNLRMDMKVYKTLEESASESSVVCVFRDSP